MIDQLQLQDFEITRMVMNSSVWVEILCIMVGMMTDYGVQAPAPPAGYQAGLGLYSQNLGPRPVKKNFRPLPTVPDRILDAPDMVDDYYLNLLDWGKGNSVSRTPTNLCISCTISGLMAEAILSVNAELESISALACCFWYQ